MKKNILLLEDDVLLAKTLEIGLTALGTHVFVANALSDFHRLLEEKKADVCVMDRMIQAEDSLGTVEYIRDAFPEIRVLLLTQKSAISERIAGLEAGAHDYLPKPFSLAELRLRVKLLLSQSSKSGHESEISLGSVIYKPGQGIIMAHGDTIFLRPRENEIILYLSQRMSNFTSRQSIMHTLWPDSYTPHPSTVDVYIRRLRQKLGKYRSIIETRRGFGYRLIPLNGKSSNDGRTLSSS